MTQVTIDPANSDIIHPIPPELAADAPLYSPMPRICCLHGPNGALTEIATELAAQHNLDPVHAQIAVDTAAGRMTGIGNVVNGGPMDQQAYHYALGVVHRSEVQRRALAFLADEGIVKHTSGDGIEP
jgi:hypothetical protein